ncbi:MAG: OB-fold domain-containing protein [Deltaproteobacteria bacterium]|jgi:uncharacterized OB-fold protein|nr:OB-fold domain-containing protein [Deltaproteobacteria bacterium]MBW2382273.1 OB-fold domain-containing protein [Deltaproteobacteria bacterium]
MAKEIAPAIAGWYTSGDEPHLIGSQCKQCQTYFFPKQELFCKNPVCRSTEFDEVELSRRGKIWSYTEHYYRPPEPYISGEDFQPYTIAAVELEKEKMVILGQLANGVQHADLKAGLEVELVVEELYEQDDTAMTVWKWKPVDA